MDWKEKDERFTEYLEADIRNLGGGSSPTGYLESLAWKLHEELSPTGSLALAGRLLAYRVSFLRKDINAVKFARSLIESASAELSARESKDHWDCYFLAGCCKDSKEAVKWYFTAADKGNRYALFEGIWEELLSGGSRLEAILKLRQCSGSLRPYAQLGADSLSFLSTGPVREIGTTAHVFRVLQLSEIQHRQIANMRGSRMINVEVAREFERDAAALKELSTPLANFILYLIERNARGRATGKTSLEWLDAAVCPDLPELCDYFKVQRFRDEELDVIIAKVNEQGWRDSELCRLVEAERELNEWKDANL